MNKKQDAIFELIKEERQRQDVKWGANRNLDNTTWLTILVEEVGESAQAVLKGKTTLLDELIQVAAVAIAWLEMYLSDNPKSDENITWLCDCGRKHFEVYSGFECVCGNKYIGNITKEGSR